jgi:hypothetical protein
MGGDSSLCYSFEILGRCYTTCPEQTNVNTTNPSNPRCVARECTTRTPDSRGVCLITPDDECYAYNGQCLTECPGLNSAENEDEKV